VLGGPEGPALAEGVDDLPPHGEELGERFHVPVARALELLRGHFMGAGGVEAVDDVGDGVGDARGLGVLETLLDVHDRLIAIDEVRLAESVGGDDVEGGAGEVDVADVSKDGEPALVWARGVAVDDALLEELDAGEFILEVVELVFEALPGDDAAVVPRAEVEVGSIEEVVEAALEGADDRGGGVEPVGGAVDFVRVEGGERGGVWEGEVDEFNVAAKREGGVGVLMDDVVEGGVGEGESGGLAVDSGGDGKGIVVGREPHGVEGRPVDGADVPRRGHGLDLAGRDVEAEGELARLLGRAVLAGDERVQLAAEGARVDRGRFGGDAGWHWRGGGGVVNSVTGLFVRVGLFTLKTITVFEGAGCDFLGHKCLFKCGGRSHGLIVPCIFRCLCECQLSRFNF